MNLILRVIGTQKLNTCNRSFSESGSTEIKGQNTTGVDLESTINETSLSMPNLSRVLSVLEVTVKQEEKVAVRERRQTIGEQSQGS